MDDTTLIEMIHDIRLRHYEEIKDLNTKDLVQRIRNEAEQIENEINELYNGKDALVNT